MSKPEYTREDVEALIDDWQKGVCLENADARADFLLARARLVERERTALHYLCQGCDTKEVAKLLGVSPRTAATVANDCVTNVWRKMNGEG